MLQQKLYLYLNLQIAAHFKAFYDISEYLNLNDGTKDSNYLAAASAAFF